MFPFIILLLAAPVFLGTVMVLVARFMLALAVVLAGNLLLALAGPDTCVLARCRRRPPWLPWLAVVALHVVCTLAAWFLIWDYLARREHVGGDERRAAQEADFRAWVQGGRKIP